MGYKSMGAMPPGTVENLPYVEGINYDAMQPWHVVDLHRYLFFQVAFTQLEVRVSVARSLTTAFSLPAGHLDHRRAPPPHFPRPGAHRCAGAGGAAAAAHAGREGLRDKPSGATYKCTPHADAPNECANEVGRNGMFDGGGERRTSVVGAAAARCGDTCTVKYDAAFRVCASDSRDPCGAQRPALDSHLMDRV